RWSQLRSQVIHGDVTLDNALVDEHGRISGIVDWGDMSHSALVCDLTSALESLLAGREPGQVVPLALRFVDGYRSVTPLEPEELAVLPICSRPDWSRWPCCSRGGRSAIQTTTTS